MYVELRGINKHFGAYQASRDVSFGIEEGNLAALLGPSGSGKTTILRMIAGLESPDSGDIFIDGARVNDLPSSKRGIGFVFQNYALFRYMTVFDNIGFGLSVQKTPRAELAARVEELLRLIGMEGMERRYPAQLSGGQKQRVAFARALAPNPRLLLLDEPFAAIDAKVRQGLRSWLRGMISRLGLTSIFVTHDQAEAIEVADEIIVTNAGRVEQKGRPVELYKSPATPFVARFVGDSAPIGDIGRLKGFDGADADVSGVVSGAIRPEFIKIFAPGESVQCESAVEAAVVESVIFRGDALEVSLILKDTRLSARYPLEKETIAAGQKIRALVYCLYAFEGGRTRLLHNACLGRQHDAYSYSI
ncbi:MAG: ABC transporter ATP-binding protein [Desulfovibrio sp.]|nr:ABC transporter ATP-binding protein [Desulfovibrio sp.]